MIPDACRIGFAGLVGACLGSFISTAVVRQLRGEQVLTGRSHCDGCAHPLAAWATLPIISYALAGGGCRRCGARINPLHPAGEVLGGGIFAAAWWGPVFTPTDMATCGLLTALGSCLLALGLYDARTLRIPNALNAAVLATALGLVSLRSPTDTPAALLWGASTFAILDGMRRLYRQLRGEDGLGLGDVKLMSALAVWLQSTVSWALVLACILALAWIGLAACRHRRLAFGPFLAFGAFAVGTGRQLLGAVS